MTDVIIAYTAQQVFHQSWWTVTPLLSGWGSLRPLSCSLFAFIRPRLLRIALDLSNIATTTQHIRNWVPSQTVTNMYSVSWRFAELFAFSFMHTSVNAVYFPENDCDAHWWQYSVWFVRSLWRHLTGIWRDTAVSCGREFVWSPYRLVLHPPVPRSDSKHVQTTTSK